MRFPPKPKWEDPVNGINYPDFNSGMHVLYTCVRYVCLNVYIVVLYTYSVCLSMMYTHSVCKLLMTRIYRVIYDMFITIYMLYERIYRSGLRASYLFVAHRLQHRDSVPERPSRCHRRWYTHMFYIYTYLMFVIYEELAYYAYILYRMYHS